MPIRVANPYLYGLKASDLQWPLAQFNANVADAADPSGTKKVVLSINKAMKAKGFGHLEREALDRSFRRCWPEYEEALKNVPAAEKHEEKREQPAFDVQKAFEEILAFVRSGERERTRFAPKNWRISLV